MEAVTRYEAAMLAEMRSKHADILADIRDTKAMNDGNVAKLKEALADFGKTFA